MTGGPVRLGPHTSFGLTAPGSARWNERAATLEHVRDAVRAETAHRRAVWMQRAGIVARGLIWLWMLLCVSVTVWFLKHLPIAVLVPMPGIQS